MDIKLDDSGDVSFTTGESSVTTIGAEDLTQRLHIRLNTFLGEWFMDNTYGMDWWGRVFGKNRSKRAVDVLIQEQILQEPDALQIVSYESSISSSRVFSCSFKVRTEDGAITAVPSFTISPISA